MTDTYNDLTTLMSFLPSLAEKRVLLLGAADEHYQRVLQEQHAGQIQVVEGGLSDLAALHDNQKRFDFVFFHGLLGASTSDDDAAALVEHGLRLLNLGGYLFFRESCFGIEGTKRTPITIIDLVQSKALAENEVQTGFDLVFAKPNSSFSSDAASSGKVAFLFTKIVLENHHGFKTLKEFMDHKQYTRNGVLRYEKIFGAGFVSTGGIDTTLPFLEQIGLQPNQRVLDVGCGIGGGDFLMAEKYDVDVLGIDLASNMVGIAWDRSVDHKNLKANFEIGDITKQKFPSNYFDVIYSRDTILHIANKQALFAQFKDWLKPGGKVFITDYCCGVKPWSDEFSAYVSQRGYALLTVDEYGELFRQVGFATVRAEDRTDLFVQSLNNELAKMDQIKEAFVNEFSEQDFNYLLDGWKEKLVRCAAGHQKWGLFYCEK